MRVRVAVNDSRAPYLQPQLARRDEVASLQLLHAGGVCSALRGCGITVLDGHLEFMCSATVMTEQ